MTTVSQRDRRNKLKVTIPRTRIFSLEKSRLNYAVVFTVKTTSHRSKRTGRRITHWEKWLLQKRQLMATPTLQCRSVEVIPTPSLCTDALSSKAPREQRNCRELGSRLHSALEADVMQVKSCLAFICHRSFLSPSPSHLRVSLPICSGGVKPCCICKEP